MLARYLRQHNGIVLFQRYRCLVGYKPVLKSYNPEIGRQNLNSVPCARSFLQVQSRTLFSSTKPDSLTKALSDAEKLVGYSTSFLSLRCLLSDELSNAAMYVKKLINSEHPLLNTAREFVFDGQYGLQTRGLLVLLIAKAAGVKKRNATDEVLQESVSGIYNSQRQLAEITEMIHTANLIHSGVVDLDSYHKPEQVKDMAFGNRLAVLSGDFLLANACTGLAQLQNTEIVDMISKVIGDMMEGEMMICSSKTPEDFTLDYWKQLVFKCKGSLIATSCKAALKLVSHSEQLQQAAFNFGTNIAYAHQLKEELQNLRDGKMPVSVITAPIVMSMKEPRTCSLVQSFLLDKNCNGETKEPNYKQLQEYILESELPGQIKNFTRHYTDKATASLSDFPQSDAKSVLQNIALSMSQ